MGHVNEDERGGIVIVIGVVAVPGEAEPVGYDDDEYNDSNNGSGDDGNDSDEADGRLRFREPESLRSASVHKLFV